MWRESADAHGETIQFVRTFVPCDIESAPASPVISQDAEPIDVLPLAVVMRTQGKGARICATR